LIDELISYDLGIGSSVFLKKANKKPVLNVRSVLSGVWVNIEKAGVKNLLFLHSITSQIWVFMI